MKRGWQQPSSFHLCLVYCMKLLFSCLRTYCLPCRLFAFIEGFEIDLDCDIFTDEPTTSFKRLVPVEIPLFAVNFRFCAQSSNLHAPGIFTLAIIFCVENNRLCHTMHGQIAIYFVFVA